MPRRAAAGSPAPVQTTHPIGLPVGRGIGPHKATAQMLAVRRKGLATTAPRIARTSLLRLETSRIARRGRGQVPALRRKLDPILLLTMEAIGPHTRTKIARTSPRHARTAAADLRRTRRRGLTLRQAAIPLRLALIPRQAGATLRPRAPTPRPAAVTPPLHVPIPRQAAAIAEAAVAGTAEAGVITAVEVAEVELPTAAVVAARTVVVVAVPTAVVRTATPSVIAFVRKTKAHSHWVGLFLLWAAQTNPHVLPVYNSLWPEVFQEIEVLRPGRIVWSVFSFDIG
jgi:hypothetical protein